MLELLQQQEDNSESSHEQQMHSIHAQPYTEQEERESLMRCSCAPFDGGTRDAVENNARASAPRKPDSTPRPAQLDLLEVPSPTSVNDCDKQTPTAGWTALRSTVKVAGAMKQNRKRNRKTSHGVSRQDSFLKKFSTRYGGSTQAEADNDKKTDVNQKGKSLSPQFEQIEQPKAAVINPDGNFMFYWLGVVTIAVLYNLWSCIAREGFPDLRAGYDIYWFVADGVCDFIYLSDIIIQLRTGYLERGLVVYSSHKLALHYTRSKFFVIDVLALLPLDLFQILIGIHPLVRFPRFLKAYRAYRFSYMVETRTVYPNMWRVANLSHILFLGSHWFAAFYYMISKAEDFKGRWGYPKPVEEFAFVTRKYLKCLYWSTLTLTTIGDLPPPETNWEYLFTILSYLIGVFVFATIVGQVGNVITNRNASRQEFERLLDGAKAYMRNHNVPNVMQRRVQRWYDYAWSRGRMNGGGDINSLGLLPDKLKTELALHVNLETLKKVTIFQECEPEFLHDLVLKMKAFIFTPGDLICRKGEVAREMFIIADGLLEVISDSGEVLTQMSAGDFFGEIGILNLDGGVNRRTADVRSVGYSELFVLSREDVLGALKDHPEAEAVIKKCARKRLNELNTHNLKKRAETSAMLQNIDDEDGLINKMAASSMSVLTGVAQVCRESPSRLKLENGPCKVTSHPDGGGGGKSQREQKQASFLNKVLRRGDKAKSQSTSQIDRLQQLHCIYKVSEESADGNAMCSSIEDDKDDDPSQPLIKTPSDNDVSGIKGNPNTAAARRFSLQRQQGVDGDRGRALAPRKARTNSFTKKTDTPQEARPFYDDVLFPKVYYNQDLFFNSDGVLVTDLSGSRQRCHSSGSSMPKKLLSCYHRRWSSVKDRLSPTCVKKRNATQQRSFDDADAYVIERTGRPAFQLCHSPPVQMSSRKHKSRYASEDRQTETEIDNYCHHGNYVNDSGAATYYDNHIQRKDGSLIDVRVSIVNEHDDAGISAMQTTLSRSRDANANQSHSTMSRPYTGNADYDIPRRSSLQERKPKNSVNNNHIAMSDRASQRRLSLPKQVELGSVERHRNDGLQDVAINASEETGDIVEVVKNMVGLKLRSYQKYYENQIRALEEDNRVKDSKINQLESQIQEMKLKILSLGRNNLVKRREPQAHANLSTNGSGKFGPIRNGCGNQVVGKHTADGTDTHPLLPKIVLTNTDDTSVQID